mgnify:CR=1 FL=1
MFEAYITHFEIDKTTPIKSKYIPFNLEILNHDTIIGGNFYFEGYDKVMERYKLKS